MVIYVRGFLSKSPCGHQSLWYTLNPKPHTIEVRNFQANKLIEKVFIAMVKEQKPDVLIKKSCSRKFCKINRKTSVLRVPFLIKLQAEACNFVRKEALAQFNLVVKSKLSPRNGSVALRQSNPIHKKES